MSKKNKEGFETRAIHAGQKADPTTGAVMMPIYTCLLYTSPSPRDATLSRMPSSA